MTISSSTRKAGPFTGNDITTDFPFTFTVFSDVDVYVVMTTIATGADTVLVIDQDFSLTLNTNQNTSPGGTVTLFGPLATGYTLTLSTTLDYLQSTDLTNQGGFYPEVITRALDRTVILTQQLNEKVKQSLQVGLADDVLGELPKAAERANKVFAFGADGDIELASASAIAASEAYAKVNLALVLTGDYTFLPINADEVNLFINPGSAARNINLGPLAFRNGEVLRIVNLGSYNLTFDPTGMNAVVRPGDIGFFIYSTTWKKAPSPYVFATTPEMYGFAYGTNDAAQATINKAAIDKCILDLSVSGRGGVIQLPRGAYVCDPGIYPNFDHITIQGVGAANEYGPTGVSGTVLTFTAGSLGAGLNVGIDLTYIDGASAGSYNVLKDITISGNTVLDIGVKASGMVMLQGVNVVGCKEAGIKLTNRVDQVRLENSSAINNTGGAGIGLYIAKGASANTIMSISNFNSRSNTIGVKIEDARKLLWNNGVIENNTNEGMILYRPTGGSLETLTFNSLWFENNNAGTSNYQVVIDAQVPAYNTSGAVVKPTFNDCHFNSTGNTKNLWAKAAYLMKLNRCTSEAGAGINAILLDTYSYGCEIIDLAYNHISPQSINVGLGNIFSSVYAITPGGRNDSAYYPDAVYVTNANITAGSGTGVTVNSTGQVMRQTYQVTVDYTALSAAALTSDKIIATLPAKTRIISIIADTTIKYLGGAVSAAALKIGSTVGGGEILASHDVYTAVITKGLADADMGTSLTRAAAIQGGAILSWTAATPIYVRMTTTTANTSALTQGSTTYYITTECF